MEQEEQEVTYEKRGDVADMAGEDYELQLCALLVVRGVNHCPHGFFLASNHGQAGSFDDVVLFWRQQVGDGVSWRGMLLQLKHKQAEALGRKVFLPTPEDQAKAKGKGRGGDKKTQMANFSLVAYYQSYCHKVRPEWPQMVSKIGDVPIEQVTFGIFTNTGVKKMDIRDVSAAPDIVDTGAAKVTDTISRITEITFSLDEDDVKNTFSTCDDQNDASEFLGRFRLFCNQASLEKLQQLIKDELMVALGTGPGEATDGAYSALLAGVKVWWTAKKAAPFLTASSAVWAGIEHARLDDLGGPLRSAVQALNLTFTAEATAAFQQLFSASRGQPVVVACERGCGLLAVQKASQALGAAPGLPVRADAARSRLPEVCAALASRACRWLLLLLPPHHQAGDSLSADDWRRLLDALQRQPRQPKTFVLVTETDGVPLVAEDGWPRHNEHFSLLHLDAESQQRLLQKTVIFQGMSTTVGDIVQGDDPERLRRAAQLLSGRHALRLCSSSSHDPPVVGAPLADAPSYFVERPLERRRQLRDDILLAPPTDAVLAVSDLPASRQKQELREAASTFTFTDVMKHKNSRPPQIVLLQGRRPEEAFEQLCAELGAAGRSLHWVRAGSWRWERSHGESWALRGLLADGGWAADWPRDLLAAAPGERAVLLSGPPGFGKSTLLARLAAATKRRLPHALVVVVELGRYSRELHNVPSPDAASVKKLLKLAAKIDDGANEGLDSAIFDFCLDQSGEAVVVLDGYDEISHYEEEFDKLATGAAALRVLLEETRARKVWASSRPATCRPLEEAARAVAFRLRGLSDSEQERFFTLFLESAGAGAHIQQMLRQVSELQKSTSLRRHSASFLETPLHAAMLAEVVTSEDDSHVLSEGSIDLCRLYEIFFNKKADIYQLEKRKIALHEAHTAWEAAAGRDTYQETIIVFALRALFSPEEVSLLLGEQEDEEEAAALAELAAHEQTGIVFGAQAGRPHFVHRTFAEYFAALFFSWGHQRAPRPRLRARLGLLQQSALRSLAAAAASQDGPRALLAATLARDDLEFFRDMLARMLCKDMPLHMAVIHDEAEEVQRLTQGDAAAASALDSGGRSPLHLAALYNSSRAARALLCQVADDALRVEDRVLGWRPLRYADLYGAWDVADALMDFPYTPDDLQHTRDRLQRRANASTDLLRAFVQKGFCNLTRFLVVECGVSADTLTDEPRQRRPLHAAAEARDARLSRVLLEAGAHADAPDTGGRTPLQLLCALAHPTEDEQRAAVATAEALLAHGAGVAHALSTAGVAPLHDAASKGCAPLLRCLLTKGRGVTAETLVFPTKKGLTALHVAAASNRLEALQTLLELGGDPNTTDKTGATPLHVAARHGFVQEVRLLVAAGASACARDLAGRAPLHHATTGQCVDALVAAGADPNLPAADGLTPLSFAVANGCTNNLVAALVHHSADVTAMDSEGNSAVYVAASFGNSRAVAIMTKNNKSAGEEALRHAIERCDVVAMETLVLEGLLPAGEAGRLQLLKLAAAYGSEALVAPLLEYGFPAKAADAEGRTALHCAAAAGRSDVCKLLLQYGVDVRARDTQGREPLHDVANEQTAQALIDSGAVDINAVDHKGCTPLHAAAAANRMDVARLLLGVGCDVDWRDNEGNTPLHAAVGADHVHMVRLLLGEGADHTARNKQGQLPLEFARRLGGKGRKYENIFHKAPLIRKTLANTKN